MDYIIIHSSEDTPLKKNKWHFFIRKTGEIETLVPIYKNTRHCMGKNKVSIAVCFEGAFNKDEVNSKLQLESGKKLLKKLKMQHPESKVLPHRAFLPVDCPGDCFPIRELVNEVKCKRDIDKI